MEQKNNTLQMWRGFSERDGSTVAINNLVEDRELFRLQQRKGQRAGVRWLSTSANSIVQKVLHGFGFVVSLSVL